MKLVFRVLFLLITFSVLSSGVISAQAPTPPVLFQGKVTIDGVAAPIGTVVAAEVDGIEAASTPDGIKEIGKYMLAVPDNGYIGKMVVFKVNDIVASEHEYISSMDTPVIELDLDVKTGSSGLGPIAIAGIVAGTVAIVVVVVLLIRRKRLE